MVGTHDMTTGPIAKQLIVFSLPLLASSLIQQLYNTVDLIFVGHLIGTNATAAVGACSLLVTCLVGFFTGLSIGSGVVSGQYFGGRDFAKLKRVICSAITICLICGLAFSILAWLSASLLLEAMNTPDAVFDDAVRYLKIYFLSLTSMVTYNVGAGIVRALGNSTSPMIYQLYGGLGNVVANWFFVAVLGWGIQGSAIATVISQTLAESFVFHHLLRLDERYRFDWNFKVDLPSSRRILIIGIPAGIQATAITLSNICVQYFINSMGVDAVAAFASYFKVELFIYLPILACGQAVTNFVAQNMGARQFHRLDRGMRIAIAIGMCITLPMSAIMIFGGRYAFSIFVDSPEVIDLGCQLIMISFPFYFIYVVLEVCAASMRGRGRALLPMCITVFNLCGLRLGLLIWFTSYDASAQSIVAVYPWTWLSTAVMMAVASYGTRKIDSRL